MIKYTFIIPMSSKLPISEELISLQRLLDKTEKEIMSFRKESDFDKTNAFHEKSVQILEMYDVITQEFCNKLYIHDHLGIKVVTEKLARGYKQLLNSILKFSIRQYDLNSIRLEHQQNNRGSTLSLSHHESIGRVPTQRTTPKTRTGIHTPITGNISLSPNRRDNSVDLKYPAPTLLGIPGEPRSTNKTEKTSRRASIHAHFETEEDQKNSISPTFTQLDAKKNLTLAIPRSIGFIDDQSHLQNQITPTFDRRVSKSYIEIPEEKKFVYPSLDGSLKMEAESYIDDESEQTKRDLDEALKSLRDVLANSKASASSAHLKQVLRAFANTKQMHKGLLDEEKQIRMKAKADLGVDEIHDQLLKVYDKTQRKTAKRVLSFVEKEQKEKQKTRLQETGTDPDYELLEREKRALLKEKDEEWEKKINTKDSEIQKLKDKYNEEHYQYSLLKHEVLHYKAEVADLGVERTELSKQVRELKSEVASLGDKVARKKMKINDFKSQAVSKNSSEKQKQDKFDLLVFRNNELTAKNRELEAEIAELKHQITTLQSREEELLTKKGYLEKMVHESEKETDDLYARIEKLEAENKEILDSLAGERVKKSKQLELEMQVEDAKSKYNLEKSRAEMINNMYEKGVKLLASRNALPSSRTSLESEVRKHEGDSKVGGEKNIHHLKNETPKHQQQQGKTERISLQVPNAGRKDYDAPRGSRRNSRVDQSIEISLHKNKVEQTQEIKNPDSRSRASSNSEHSNNPSIDIAMIQHRVGGGNRFSELTPRNNYGSKSEFAECTPKRNLHENSLKHGFGEPGSKHGLEESTPRNDAYSTPRHLVSKFHRDGMSSQKDYYDGFPLLPREKTDSRPNDSKSSERPNKRPILAPSADKETQTTDKTPIVPYIKLGNITHSPLQKQIETTSTSRTNNSSQFTPIASQALQVPQIVKNLKENGVTLQQLIEFYEQVDSTPHSIFNNGKSSFALSKKKLSNVVERCENAANEYGQTYSLTERNSGRAPTLFRNTQRLGKGAFASDHKQASLDLDSTDDLMPWGSKDSITPTNASLYKSEVMNQSELTPRQLSKLKRPGEFKPYFKRQINTDSSEKSILHRTYRMPSYEEADLAQPSQSKELNLTKIYETMQSKLPTNPSLKKIFKNTVAKRYRESGKSFDANKFEVTLEDFKQYFNEFERVHKKCGESCPHLRRFYEKIGYAPHLEDRVPLPLPKTDIDKLPRIVRKIYLR